MKKTQIKYLIESIVKETLGMMQEEHQRGEWWIDQYGDVDFADGDIGDANHEGVVIRTLAAEILEHFGVNDFDPEGGYLSEQEEEIKQALLDDDRLSEEELAIWDNQGSGGQGPAAIILKKLIEDHVYPDPKQAEDALFIAYGSNTRDARNYAMKHWKWKIMKASGGQNIEIMTWHLTADDLAIVVKGIWEIMEESNEDDPEDSDNEVGEDNYKGPRINLSVYASGKRFTDIPLAVLEKKLPSAINTYGTGAGMKENIQEEFHHLHKEYRLYEGRNKIVAIFEDNSRIAFEVHFRDNHGEDREKWRHKALTSWKSLANEIHRDVQLSEVGNPIEKTWKECFREALKDPKMKEYMRAPHHQRVFDDKGYPAKIQGKPAPCIDPVNFTQMG